MKTIKQPKSIKSIFDESFHQAARFENETYEDYKKRRTENKRFLKMYSRFGRERFMQFMKFFKQMGEQENTVKDAE